jgi:chromate transport protein ChrA
MNKAKYIFRSVKSPKVLIDLTGILLAMFLAGVLGRYAAQVATRQISDELTKLVVGIVIGACIGLGTGFVIHRTLGRLMGIVSNVDIAGNRKTA